MRISPPSKQITTNPSVKRIASEVFVDLSAQQRLYFLPLPQGQGSFRPIADMGSILSLQPTPSAARGGCLTLISHI